MKAFTVHSKAHVEVSKPPVRCNSHSLDFTHMCLAKDCPSRILCSRCAQESHIVHNDSIHNIQEYLAQVLTSPRNLEDENLKIIHEFLNTKNDVFEEINSILFEKENDILSHFDDLKSDINELLDIAYQNYVNQIREKHNAQLSEVKHKIEKIEKIFKIQKVMSEKKLPTFEFEEEISDLVKEVYKHKSTLASLAPIIQQKYNKLKLFINDKSNFALDFDKPAFMKLYKTILDHIKTTFDIRATLGSSSNGSGSMTSSANSEEAKKDSYQGHEGDICSLAILNKDTVATAGHDYNIKLWDLKSSECMGELSGHKDIIWSIKAAYDGKYLLSASSDKTVKLWKLAEKRCKKTFKAHTKPVYCIEFLPHLKLLASGSQDNSIMLWDMNEGKLWKSLIGHQKAVWNLRQMGEDKLISCSEDCSIKIWDIKGGVCLQTLSGHTDTIYGLALFNNDTTLASSSDDRTIRYWDLSSNSCTKVVTGHDKGIRSLAVNKGQSLLATGGYDHILKIWDVKSGNLLKVNDKNNAIIRAIQFIDDTSVFYCDKNVKIYKITKI